MAEENQDLGTTEEIQVEERPAWLPEQFKSPEDLAKSYSHAIPKITELGQENAALKARLDELEAAQNSRQSQQEYESVEQQLIDQWESGDTRAALGVQAYLIQQANEQLKAELLAEIQGLRAPQSTELVVDYAERKIAGEFPDWPEYKAKVGEAVAANPALMRALEGETNPEVIAGHLRTAYKIAKFDAGQAHAAQAEQSLGDLNRQIKNQAQTMTGGSQAEDAPSYFDQVKAARGGVPSFVR